MAVEGWTRTAYCVPQAKPRRPRRQHGTLLSPFDSLIWNRPRTERLFGFHYRLGIYVPGHLRTHGYYVLPLLMGDELVGRFGLKADRKESTLRVMGFVCGAGGRPGDGHRRHRSRAPPPRPWLGLHHLGRRLRLEHLAVAPRGGLARGLRAGVTRGRRAVRT